MNALSQSNDLFACNLIYCLRTCQTPWHSARGRALLPCENLSVRFTPSRNTGGRKWVNGYFSTLLRPAQNPRVLNDVQKVQSRGNARARAHVFMVRLGCPAVVTKLEGPRLSRLQPLLSFALLVKSSSVRFAHAHAKRKVNEKQGWAGGPNFGSGASARKIRHSALSSSNDRLRSI